MKRIKFFILALLLVFQMSCGGGGGSNEGASNTPAANNVDDGPTSEGSKALDEDDFVVYAGTLAPPGVVQPEKVESSARELSLEMVNGVPWVCQIPPGALSEFDWKITKNCGPVSYLMIDAYYQGYLVNKDNSESKIKEIIDWMADNIKNYNPPYVAGVNRYYGDETNINQLYALAEILGGYQARAFINGTVSILLDEIKKGHPVIVAVPTQGDNNTNTMKTTGYGHFMVLVGIDDNYVYLNDPGRSAETYGKYRKFTRSSFMSSWEHCGVYIYPQNTQLPVSIPVKSLALSNGTVNQAFYAVLSAIDGKPPYEWSIIDGNLPNGLTLTSAGVIAGIPTQNGKFDFTVRVQDSSQGSVTITDGPTSIIISQALTSHLLTITAAQSLPSGQLGIPYQLTLSGSGGKGPYKWSILSGNLPPGLFMDVSSGIRGTPTMAGTYTFRVQISDNSSPQTNASKEFTLVILSSSMTSIGISTSSAGPWAANVSGKQGSTFFIQGKGFTRNSAATQYIIKPDGAQIKASVSVDGSGFLNWSYTSNCNDLTGDYQISVEDASGKFSNSLIETITGSTNCNLLNLTASPSFGAQGTIFYYSGNNYTPNGVVEWHVLKPDNTEYPPAELSGKINGAGKFSHAYSSHCGSMAGNYAIWAIDKATGRQSNTVYETITASFSCNAVTLSVSPSLGTQGTAFNYSGSNYTPNGIVQWHVLKPDNFEYPPTDLPGKVDGNGNFNYTYVSHCGSMAGAYAIWAIDKSSGKESNTVYETITTSAGCN